MKRFSLFISLVISVFVFSQKTVDAEIITIHDDTLRVKMQVRTNIFYRDLIDEASFYRNIKTINENGKKEKLKAYDVTKLTFTDFKGKKRVFVNADMQLNEIMYSGKLKWIRTYYVNLYDGSTQASDLYIDEKGEVFNPFFSRKKALLKVTAAKPELAQEIENTDFAVRNSEELILMFFEKYEEL